MRLKRLISAFIACAMLVTFMPMQAFAVDDAGEATTWTKELSVDELYDTVQDQLDGNNAIALEDPAAFEATAYWDISKEGDTSSSNTKTTAWYVWKNTDNSASDDEYGVAVLTNYHQIQKDTNWDLHYTHGGVTTLTISVDGKEVVSKESAEGTHGANSSDCWAIQFFGKDDVRYDESSKSYVINLIVPGGFDIGKITLSDDFIEKEILSVPPESIEVTKTADKTSY